MIEDVQRQMAGLSFQDGKNSGAYNYPPVGQPHQTQRSTTQQQTDPVNMPHPPRPQASYYQPPPPEQPTMPGYTQPLPPYAQQPPPPYHVAGSPYPPPQAQQPLPSHEYGQPAYPGWRGPYYNNAQPQQSGSLPRPPYTVPAPYSHHQGGYYKQQ